METAIEQLLLAFAKADRERTTPCDHVEWEDIELAFALAREALPGRYLDLVRELNERDADEALEDFNYVRSRHHY